jgi:type I restriction enzyme S subunit
MIKGQTEMSEWKECKLGDIINSNVSSITTSFPYDRIFYIDTGSITAGKLETYQEMKLS